MTTPDRTDLRRTSVRLAIQFALLILLLFALVFGVVFTIVNASLAESTQHLLYDTSRVDSPRDAPPGVFVAIITNAGTQTSDDAPDGLPDTAAIRQVTQTGHDLEQTKTFSGRTFTLRTSADDGRITQVAVDQREGSEELQRLAIGFLVSGILAVIATALIAAWMARRALKPMADALNLQRRFVTDASHELRTPLTLLSTRAQLVRRGFASGGPAASPATVSVGLDEIVQDSQVLTEILEDLLIAADPREVAERKSEDLLQLAADAVNTLQPHATAHQIILRRTGPTEAVIATIAPVSIQRLFTALIANALDHATAQVDVEVTRHGNEALIRVIDDGPGFSNGMDEHAFERFASARQTSGETPRPRHYGLGLALVAEVAARHHGGVRIEKRPSGTGAVVTVRIPMQP